MYELMGKTMIWVFSVEGVYESQCLHFGKLSTERWPYVWICWNAWIFGSHIPFKEIITWQRIWLITNCCKLLPPCWKIIACNLMQYIPSSEVNLEQRFFFPSFSGRLTPPPPENHLDLLSMIINLETCKINLSSSLSDYNLTLWHDITYYICIKKLLWNLINPNVRILHNFASNCAVVGRSTSVFWKSANPMMMIATFYGYSIWTILISS